MKYFDRPAAWLAMIAVLFELALGALALALGGMLSFWPLVGFTTSPPLTPLAAIGWGLVATAPMTAVLAIVVASPWQRLTRLKSLAQRLLSPLLVGVHPLELILVSLAAGLGEEILFRGLIQAGLASWWAGIPLGWLAAWLLASVLFGVCHWVSGTYAILAAAAGLYLGLLLIVFDHLLVPITAHALYDLAALMYLRSDEP